MGILEYCGYCSGTRQGVEQQKTTDITFIGPNEPYKPVISFKTIPDIKLTEKSRCYMCRKKITSQEHVSICCNVVFFFCTNDCYLQWLKKNPTTENFSDEVEL